MKPSRAGRAKYCSKGCFDDARRRVRVRDECDWCGNVFEVVPSRFLHGRGKHCSRKCQYESNSSKLRTGSRKELKCLNCGNSFEKLQSYLESKLGAGKYCSRECRDKHRRGDNHPQYIHGTRSDEYGSNWQAQRRKARKRDSFKCQECGVRGVPLDVHHIKPRRDFDDVKTSNILSNLVTLCKPCHRRADAEIQRQESLNEE